MSVRRVAAVAATVAGLAAPGAASAGDRPTGYGGWNPFRCTLQQAGFGTAVPDPGADPYCVEFDKRRQNITQLGIIDFLAKEPARVAAASSRCFYFQRDHWRASVVQDDGRTVLYEWDGSYFIDRATGDGGAYVEGFAVNGRSFPLHAIPGIPREYARYMGQGTGGMRTRNAVPVDPRCVTRARAGGVYAPGGQEGRPARQRDARDGRGAPPAPRSARRAHRVADRP